MTTEADNFQEEIKALVDEGRINDAVDLAIKTHGGEIFGYLARLAKDEDVAGDAFQAFSLDLWRGLPNFEWRSAFKTWAYTLARRALYRQYDSAYHRRGQRLHTEQELQLQDRWSRSATAIWRQTQTKHWMWEIISEFDPDDQEMLTLRVVHNMGWTDIVQVLAPEDTDLDNKELKRQAAGLRKRFQRLKDRLREARLKRKSEEDE